MYDEILVPYDGSDEAMKGADDAIQLAAAVGASIRALYVINISGTPRSVYISQDDDELKEDFRSYGREVTTDLCDRASEEGVDCSTVIRSGDVATEIVDYADAEEMDLIMMGSGYKGAIGSLLGGKASKVVRNATVPVTTCRVTQSETPGKN
jgi:Universal stress protein UspA and related nucleotide-binding proteins